jgi:hypothetical protein
MVVHSHNLSSWGWGRSTAHLRPAWVAQEDPVSKENKKRERKEILLLFSITWGILGIDIKQEKELKSTPRLGNKKLCEYAFKESKSWDRDGGAHQ